MTRLEQALTDALRAAGMRYGLNWEDLAFTAMRAIDEQGYLIVSKVILDQFRIFANERRAQGSSVAATTWLECAHFISKAAQEARPLPPLDMPDGNVSGNSGQEYQWARDLYDFLLREYEASPESGSVVTMDARPHFDALCVFLAQHGSTIPNAQ